MPAGPGYPRAAVDGIHDLGGLHGFGAVRPEAGDPVFHAPWEGRTFGLVVTTGLAGLARGSVRPRIEAMPPADYLASAYYERWAFALERGLVDGGVLAEFGTVVPDGVELTVWDSSAEVRYLVLPQRPAGTDGLAEGELAALVTRDHMIGVVR